MKMVSPLQMLAEKETTINFSDHPILHTNVLNLVKSKMLTFTLLISLSKDDKYKYKKVN